MYETQQVKSIYLLLLPDGTIMLMKHLISLHSLLLPFALLLCSIPLLLIDLCFYLNFSPLSFSRQELISALKHPHYMLFLL